jgi:SH3-like domain-containing protein
VRADANGRARIIGSVGPDTRVQLGESRGGWRRIKARGLAGWVDGRASFVRAPAPRRSGRLATQ